MPDWYDPFAEPNTIPNGWDVSELASKDTSKGNEKAQEHAAGRTPRRIRLSLN